MLRVGSRKTRKAGTSLQFHLQLLLRVGTVIELILLSLELLLGLRRKPIARGCPSQQIGLTREHSAVELLLLLGSPSGVLVASKVEQLLLAILKP